MRRRNFLKMAGSATAALIPFLRARSAPAATEEPRYQLVRPSTQGRPAPPPSDFYRNRRRQFGTLTPENASAFALEMMEMFGGRKLAVATFHGEEWVDLHTDAELIADWTDHSEDPVKAIVDEDGWTAISFSCGGYFYTFDSRAKPGAGHIENGVTYKNSYFSFEGEKLTVRCRSFSGHLCEYVFRIQHEGSGWKV